VGVGGAGRDDGAVGRLEEDVLSVNGVSGAVPERRGDSKRAGGGVGNCCCCCCCRMGLSSGEMAVRDRVRDRAAADDLEEKDGSVEILMGSLSVDARLRRGESSGDS